MQLLSLQSSGSLPLAGRVGEGVEVCTGFDHPSLTLKVEKGPEE
jgi:hypothetical protein